MARNIKISAGILNIRIHPHSERSYQRLIETLFGLKRVVQLHGDRKAVISLIDRSKLDAGEIGGTITTFIDIETDGVWFDAENLKEATSNQVSQIRIPQNLHPNAASFYFSLDSVKHRIYVQTYSRGKQLTIPMALKFFKTLVDDARIFDAFGDVKITVVQTRAALEKILKLEIIKELIIEIEQPNPDIFSADFEENVEKHLEATNSKKVTVSYEAEQGKSVKADDNINKLGALAIENGKISARGRDKTGAVTISSDSYPRIIQSNYDPDLQSEAQAFRSLVSSNGTST